MKFRIGLLFQSIYRFFQKVYRSRFFVWLRKTFFVWLQNTLLYNMAMVFFLAFLVLWVVFRLAPQNAHVAYEASNIKTLSVEALGDLVDESDLFGIIDINNEKIVMEINGAYFTIKDFDEMEITFSSNDCEIEMNGKIYNCHGFWKLGDKIIAKPRDEWSKIYIRSEALCRLYTYGDSQLTYNPDSTLENTSVRSKSLSFNMQSFKWSEELKSVEIKPAELEFSNCEAYLSISGENIPISNEGEYTSLCKVTVHPFGGINLDFNSDCKLNFHLNPYLASCKAEIKGISSISRKSYGTVDFSYSPAPTQYLIKNQEVNLNSEDGRLQADIIFNEDTKKIDVNGMVDKATISGMSLLPSFWGWYRDNIYLAPLTLLTTIFGGVAIMINKKKRNGS